ncbi:HotDog domain-containing protein [Mortierella sp. GBAus27b]|nr:hypothetical protein BGX31_010668 [Mortierella sp. GBA43]KAI8352219.1 HotDog domain-containing protein [Mortierella sp. GBAus27b]
MPISAVAQESESVAPVKTLVEAISQEGTITTSTTSTAPSSSHQPSEREQELQKQLEALEIVQEHVAKTELWKRRTAYSLVTDDYRVHHLTAGTLRGDGMLSVAPALFQSLDEGQIVSVLHVGKSLCGHPNIVHGGLLATILDEITAMSAIPNLPGKSGFTANLNINYRHPCIADQFIIAHAELTSTEGRKAFVKATLKTLQGTLLAEATALFIAPKIPVSQITEQLNQEKGATHTQQA